MQLSVVIPVYNDPEGLHRLLVQIGALGIFSQVVVVDDASTVSCRPKDIGIDPAQYPIALKYLRIRKNRGAGHARNQGLKLVTGSHVLFFDSDDLFVDGIVSLVADLQDQDFDFCIFKHVDSRVRAKGEYGLLDSDEAIWQEVGAIGTLDTLTARAATHLCRVAAYPWNKIYRTEFLRSQNIRCTEISIHNDIEIHWISFLRAQTILLSNRICCEHFVIKNQNRLTNKTGRERFEVLQALASVQREFCNNPEFLPFLESFVGFYMGLFDWIIKQLEPSLHAEFHHAMRHFLYTELSPALFTLATTRNPDLGRRIIGILRGQTL